jgi:hypothetical protein
VKKRSNQQTNHPRYAIISPEAMLGLVTANVEDPHTEPLLTLHGTAEEDVIKVSGSYNWHTAARERKEVTFGNLSALDRVIAFDEAMRAHRQGVQHHSVTRMVGDAHSHTVFDECFLGEDDIADAKEMMEIFGYPNWVSIVMTVKKIDPEKIRQGSLSVEYKRSKGRPTISFVNGYKKPGQRELFGLETTFSGYYISNGILSRGEPVRYVEIPIRVDETAIRKYFTIG